MGSKIKTPKGNTLYEFWGGHIAEQLLRDGHGTSTIVVNCASAEYYKSVGPYLKTTRIITCEFPGPSVYAKKARGMICRYAVKNGVKTPNELRQFTGWGEDRYRFSESKSHKDKFVFIRTTPKGKENKITKRSRSRSNSPPRSSKKPSLKRSGANSKLTSPVLKRSRANSNLSRKNSTSSVKSTGSRRGSKSKSAKKPKKAVIHRLNSTTSVKSTGSTKSPKRKGSSSKLPKKSPSKTKAKRKSKGKARRSGSKSRLAKKKKAGGKKK